MKKILNYVAITIILLLGALHVILTPLFYKTFDINTLWFAGAGLSFLFLGIVNVSRIRSTDGTIKVLCVLVNTIGLIYCILIFTIIAKIQVYVTLFILVLLFVLSFIDLFSPRK